jgi:hypothetical protein
MHSNTSRAKTYETVCGCCRLRLSAKPCAPLAAYHTAAWRRIVQQAGSARRYSLARRVFWRAPPTGCACGAGERQYTSVTIGQLVGSAQAAVHAVALPLLHPLNKLHLKICRQRPVASDSQASYGRLPYPMAWGLARLPHFYRLVQTHLKSAGLRRPPVPAAAAAWTVCGA